ncbi:MAG: hypothetical protein NVSMB12_19020 [Acidimicrobiales bacterium]
MTTDSGSMQIPRLCGRRQQRRRGYGGLDTRAERPPRVPTNWQRPATARRGKLHRRAAIRRVTPPTGAHHRTEAPQLWTIRFELLPAAALHPTSGDRSLGVEPPPGIARSDCARQQPVIAL